MTAYITKVTGPVAWDLLYADHFAMLSDIARDSMHRAIHNSEVLWIGSNDGIALCIYGLIPPTLISDRAYLWLYTTEHFTLHQFMFVRHSQRVVADMLQHYPILVGHCETSNRRAQRWLRWLGAEFSNPIEDKLLPFEIKAKQWPPQLVQSA